MSIRIGTGFDVHAFGDGDHLMLGGVRVPHERGVLAHSDGDVVLHALCDAILGALAQEVGKGLLHAFAISLTKRARREAQQHLIELAVSFYRVCFGHGSGAR